MILYYIIPYYILYINLPSTIENDLSTSDLIGKAPSSVLDHYLSAPKFN